MSGLVFRHPHIVALDLTKEERDLCSYWLSGHEVIFHESLDHPPMGESIHYYRNGSLSTIGSLMDWNVPVLAITGQKPRMREMYGELFSRGCGALWEIPSPEQPLLFPRVTFPEKKRPAFLHIKDGNFRRLIRQILMFAGYPVRADFRSTDEMVVLLQEIGQKEESDLLWPALILVDLDAPDSSAARLVNGLRKLMRNHTSLRREIRVMLMKDFDIPGPPLSGLASEAGSLVSRIFHPYEATLALVESLLLKGESNPVDLKPIKIRTLDDFLFGQIKDFPGDSPGLQLQWFMSAADGFSRALPFLWLHDYLLAERKNRGITLTPSREILFDIGVKK